MARVRQHLRAGIGALRSTAIDSIAHAFARVRYSMPDANPARHGLVLERDVVYGKTRGTCHKLDIYTPARAERPLPVVMYVHGGGFSMLSKETHRVMAAAIARQGYLVFNVNYRLGLRHLFPEPLEDVSDALLWVAASCGRYGGDRERIALAGESAGGNLVMALSIMCSYRRDEPFARKVYDANIPLRATVATYPFADLTETARYLAHPKMAPWAKGMLVDAAISYVGADVARGAKAFPLASPLVLLEEGKAPERPLPPFFASVGTKDPLLSQSKRLKAALDKLGVPCELMVSPGEVHGFDAMVWRPAARLKWRRTHAFLKKHLAPPSAPAASSAALRTP